MSIPSIESRRLRNVGSEESDEYVFLGDLIRFVENSDQSIPRIAELMGISSVVLSMWIAGTAKPTTTKLLEIKRFFERYASEHVDSSGTLRS